MLIFNIIEVPEKNFKRDGDNLIYTAKISLMDALDSISITLVLLT
jgi:DnaJ-class molecular chaperone